MEIKNKEVFERFLKEALKEGVTTDVNNWMEDLETCVGNGNYSFEISKQYTKSGNPELISFDVEFIDNEDGSIDTIIEF